MVQIKRVRGNRQPTAKEPLWKQLAKERHVEERGGSSKRKTAKRQPSPDDDDASPGEEPAFAERQTKAILKAARLQQAEIQQEAAAAASDSPADGSDDDASSDGSQDLPVDFSLALSPEEFSLVEQFDASNLLACLQPRPQPLAASQQPQEETPACNPQLLEAYGRVATLLGRYKSGKLPKAFKVLPSLPQWPLLLEACRPAGWTPQAVLEGTRLFASSLHTAAAKRFFAAVLLPRFRADMAATGQQQAGRRHLSSHLFEALLKACYKPAAFFQAVVLPLAAADDGTLREAAVLGSVLAKASIPAAHSAAALLALAAQRFTSVGALLMRTLLDKKHSLPAPVVGRLAAYFGSFLADSRQLPVLWHQALLALCQRYRAELSDEQAAALVALVASQHHYLLSPEICRQLANRK